MQGLVIAPSSAWFRIDGVDSRLLVCEGGDSELERMRFSAVTIPFANITTRDESSI